MRESFVEDYLRARIKGIGGECRKVKWIGRRGAPDERCRTPYGAFWVEVKKPGASLGAHQAREIAKMRELGETVFVVDSPAEVDRMLDDVSRWNLITHPIAATWPESKKHA